MRLPIYDIVIHVGRLTALIFQSSFKQTRKEEEPFWVCVARQLVSANPKNSRAYYCVRSHLSLITRINNSEHCSE